MEAKLLQFTNEIPDEVFSGVGISDPQIRMGLVTLFYADQLRRFRARISSFRLEIQYLDGSNSFVVRGDPADIKRLEGIQAELADLQIRIAEEIQFFPMSTGITSES